MIPAVLLIPVLTEILTKLSISNGSKYLSKINYTYLTTSCLLPIFTRKLILHDYLTLLSFH
ncbi:hypothetical protein B5D77_21755 [Microcystis sp. MC19]|nr:hypothetical protein B5D77_21755 [Microcystis sp. MC19]